MDLIISSDDSQTKKETRGRKAKQNLEDHQFFGLKVNDFIIHSADCPCCKRAAEVYEKMFTQYKTRIKYKNYTERTFEQQQKLLNNNRRYLLNKKKRETGSLTAEEEEALKALNDKKDFKLDFYSLDYFW
jgi:transposase